MSFRPDNGALAICNRALARVGQGPISSIDPPIPPNTFSRACARSYKQVVANLLEAHHWNLATTRLELTELTNDRTGEWVYKYQLPPEVAFPVTFAPLTGVGAVQYYRGLAGLLATMGGRPVFLKAGSTLYSRVAGALDFVSYDITEADFTATFAGLVELLLAASIAFEITKSRLREDDLRKQATSAMNIAYTNNLNAGGPRYGDGPSEREWVRGVDAGLPWDWWPGAI